MTRRRVLELLGLLGVAGLGLFSDMHLLRRVYYRIQDLFSSPPRRLTEAERETAALPEAGRRISVETALNSRCTSDDDGNPLRFHWGMFDERNNVPPACIGETVALAKTLPRFGNGPIDILVDGNVLTFVVDNTVRGIGRGWLMVESGMQQQAVGLVCAAFGVGMVFRSLGDDGTHLSDSRWATTSIRLDAMRPSYDGAYWTSKIPRSTRPWMTGNLPDPVRSGRRELIWVLGQLKLENAPGLVELDLPRVSQLLWAARGRTPHFYKSQPWGLTIPTSRGDQSISSLYVLSGHVLSRYVIWRRNHPTHSLNVVTELCEGLKSRIQGLFPGCDRMILLGANEDRGRALWEVGYQLLNLLLQAAALSLGYKAILLKEEQQSFLDEAGVRGPIAALLLRGSC